MLRKLPSTEVAALVGSQYYWICHYHPAFLLAYFVVMECDPLDLADIVLFNERTGFPAAAFRTMEAHARLDPGHGQDLFRFLETCSLSDQVFEGWSTCSISTSGYLARIFADIGAQAVPA